MFIWSVPFGYDITFAIGIFAVNIIIGGVISVFVPAWKTVAAAWYISLKIYLLIAAVKDSGTDIYIEE